MCTIYSFKMKLFLIFVFIPALVWCVQLPRYLSPETPEKVQETAVRGVIERCVGKSAATRFQVFVNKLLPFRSFRIKSENNKVTIHGSDGVSAAKGFHYYLKYFLHKDVTWTNTSIELPANFSLPKATLQSEAANSFIYYQNVCTWSYSFPWWDFASWRRHIDWMAMMGISLTIAPIQEQLWYELYSDLGLTETEIHDHLVGPAFLAWQRMGNIRGWGGGLPPRFRKLQLLLQQKIIKAQRELGMTVALPGFAGHVPVALKRVYANTTFSVVDRWNNFPDKLCCPLFLEPSEPLFYELTANFLQRVSAAYGTNHIYFLDPFNEIQPKVADATYLNTTAYNIYNSMRAVDPKAIWLLQGWMFVKNIFWTDSLIKAFLTAVPKGHLVVLDLQSEQFPQYVRTHSYHGQPFIWCMLHNFGGTLGMFGSVNVVNRQIRLARDMANSSMVGVGITPEGINQNYVMYSLVLERGWERDDFDLQDWFSFYADVRYGTKSETLRMALHLLQNSVYSYYGPKRIHGKYTVSRRPALYLDTWIWYNSSSVHQSWLLMLSANASVPSTNYQYYTHDVVDITRQFLQIMGDRLYVNLMAAYKSRDMRRLNYVTLKFTKLFDDLESILATNEHFLLGKWLADSLCWATSDIEAFIFELNARLQITIWGPDAQILDYAAKQWSGVVKDYFKPRWSLFLLKLQISVQSNTKFNSTEFKQLVFNQIENPFVFASYKYPVEAYGDTFKVSQRIFNDWTSLFDDSRFLHELRDYVKILNYKEHVFEE